MVLAGEARARWEPRDGERIEQLERESAELRAQIAELKRIVEELKSRPRKDKKQAHPFGRDQENGADARRTS